MPSPVSAKEWICCIRCICCICCICCVMLHLLCTCRGDGASRKQNCTVCNYWIRYVLYGRGDRGLFRVAQAQAEVPCATLEERTAHRSIAAHGSHHPRPLALIGAWPRNMAHCHPISAFFICSCRRVILQCAEACCCRGQIHFRWSYSTASQSNKCCNFMGLY